MTTPSSHQPLAEETHDPERRSTADMARHVEEKARSSVRAVGEQLDRVSWLDLAVGVAIGFGLGYLACSRRSPHSLSEVMSDSVAPWASRRVHGALDSVKRSRPVCGLAETLERLRAS